MLSRLTPMESDTTSAEDGGTLGVIIPRTPLSLGCDSLPEAFLGRLGVGPGNGTGDP